MERSRVSQVAGYQELTDEVLAGLDKASRTGDVPRIRALFQYQYKLIGIAELWLAFEKAGRWRLIDRVNPTHSPGKVTGKNSVAEILGISKNAVYNRLLQCGVIAENFAGADSLTTVVERSPLLRETRTQITAYTLQE